MLLPKRKVDLYALRDGLLKSKQTAKLVDPVVLNDLVDKFIDWYSKNMVKGFYTEIGEYQQPINMRNFIEKMAVWYELRYPDDEIYRLLSNSTQQNTNIDHIMFQTNPYIDHTFDRDSEVRILDWSDFYNADVFIKSLSAEEQSLFREPQYRSIVYLDPYRTTAHLHLSFDGTVEEAEHFNIFTYYQLKDEDLQGMHAKDVVKLLKELNIPLPSNNELEEAIRNVANWNYQKEGILNCVMYRIIERGGNRIGPRRAFLFAQEFKRDINIPMIYGIDRSDPSLRVFINEYLKAGGTADLICYSNYFSRTSQREKLSTVSIWELLQMKSPSYTEEEKTLHQQLAQVLNSQVNPEVVKKETVKQLRLQRKLEKSKRNTKMS